MIPGRIPVRWLACAVALAAGQAGGGTYAVKPGTNPNGVAYPNVPGVFTTWFSAARFANWLGNGQSLSAASGERHLHAGEPHVGHHAAAESGKRHADRLAQPR